MIEQGYLYVDTSVSSIIKATNLKPLSHLPLKNFIFALYLWHVRFFFFLILFFLPFTLFSLFFRSLIHNLIVPQNES